MLKVAHHGSEDAGLETLLEQDTPRLAVISVGEGNPYGHPTAATLAALAAAGVRTLRTDRDGTIVIDVRGSSVAVRDRGLGRRSDPRTDHRLNIRSSGRLPLPAAARPADATTR